MVDLALIFSEYSLRCIYEYDSHQWVYALQRITSRVFSLTLQPAGVAHPASPPERFGIAPQDRFACRFVDRRPEKRR